MSILVDHSAGIILDIDFEVEHPLVVLGKAGYKSAFHASCNRYSGDGLFCETLKRPLII